MKRLLIASAVLVLAACGGGDDGPVTLATTTAAPASTTGPATSGPATSGPATTTVPPTTVPPTTVRPTTLPPTTAPPTTACAPFGTTGETAVDFPLGMSSLVGKDIRTGARPCAERVVIELQPSSSPTPATFPGYRVRYAAGPVEASPSGLPVTIAGGAVLLVELGAWMQNMEGEGYQGPTEILPTNVESIEELELIENFEGRCAWAIGVDERRPYKAFTLAGPPRLVVDFYVP